MDKNNNLVLLYDHYSSLLTEKQQNFFEDYYFNNYSLSEIGDYQQISRNAVHKQLKIIAEKLLEFENKLRLYDKGKKLNDLKSKITDKKLLKLIEEIE